MTRSSSADEIRVRRCQDAQRRMLATDVGARITDSRSAFIKTLFATNVKNKSMSTISSHEQNQ